MATPSGPSNHAAQPRQKRVQPSRRRGGPGVGGCDVDIMILETQKRKSENDVLVPPSARFLLTTKTRLVPPSSSPAVEKSASGSHVNDRYFDRPEVLKSFKEQRIIQTPEYTTLPEEAIVGGRFRPRGLGEETADTSDAAYEKRHRKYETFEKRQRLREKEKLKHEHYKLKERIEQLRGMDGAAFLALPPSSFSPIPGLPAGDHIESVASLPGAHINGAAAYNEGERRRREMLDVATELDERYRVLLPPDRVRKPGPQGSANASVEEEVDAPGRDSRSRNDNAESDSEEGEPVVDIVPKEVERIKLKIKVPPKQTSSLSHSTSIISKSNHLLKRRKSSPAPLIRPPITRSRIIQVSSPPDRPDSDLASTSSTLTRPPSQFVVQPESVSVPGSPMSTPDIAVLDAEPDGQGLLPSGVRLIDPLYANANTRSRKRLKTEIRSSGQQTFVYTLESPELFTESISAPVHRSTSRLSASQAPPKSHVSYAGVAGQAERTTCALMVSALRNTSAPQARKTQRHLTAFGIKVPPEVEAQRDFELPNWLHGTYSETDGSDMGEGNFAVPHEEFKESIHIGGRTIDP